MPARPQHARPQREPETKAERKERKSREQMERAARQDRNATGPAQSWPNDEPKKIEPPDCWECTAELLRVVPCQKHGKTARRPQREF